MARYTKLVKYFREGSFDDLVTYAKDNVGESNYRNFMGMINKDYKDYLLGEANKLSDGFEKEKMMDFINGKISLEDAQNDDQLKNILDNIKSPEEISKNVNDIIDTNSKEFQIAYQAGNQNEKSFFDDKFGNIRIDPAVQKDLEDSDKDFFADKGATDTEEKTKPLDSTTTSAGDEKRKIDLSSALTGGRTTTPETTSTPETASRFYKPDTKSSDINISGIFDRIIKKQPAFINRIIRDKEITPAELQEIIKQLNPEERNSLVRYVDSLKNDHLDNNTIDRMVTQKLSDSIKNNFDPSKLLSGYQIDDYSKVLQGTKADGSIRLLMSTPDKTGKIDVGEFYDGLTSDAKKRISELIKGTSSAEVKNYLHSLKIPDDRIEKISDTESKLLYALKKFYPKGFTYSDIDYSSEKGRKILDSLPEKTKNEINDYLNKVENSIADKDDTVTFKVPQPKPEPAPQPEPQPEETTVAEQEEPTPTTPTPTTPQPEGAPAENLKKIVPIQDINFDKSKIAHYTTVDAERILNNDNEYGKMVKTVQEDNSLFSYIRATAKLGMGAMTKVDHMFDAILKKVSPDLQSKYQGFVSNIREQLDNLKKHMDSQFMQKGGEATAGIVLVGVGSALIIGGYLNGLAEVGMGSKRESASWIGYVNKLSKDDIMFYMREGFFDSIIGWFKKFIKAIVKSFQAFANLYCFLGFAMFAYGIYLLTYTVTEEVKKNAAAI